MSNVFSVYCIRPKLSAYPANDVYYGSTSLPLSTRFSAHRSAYKKGTNFTSSSSLFDKYLDNLEIVGLESALDKHTARERESYYTRLFPCVNRYKNYITDMTAYRKEYQSHYRPMYYDEHKERILALGRAKMTCNCGAVVRKYYIDTHRKTNKHTRNLEHKTSRADQNISAVCINCEYGPERQPVSVQSAECGL
jgi:hypothetical protein